MMRVAPIAALGGLLLAVPAWAQGVFDPRFHAIFPADNAVALTHPCNGLPADFTQKISGTWTPRDGDIQAVENAMPKALWWAIRNEKRFGSQTRERLTAGIANHAFQYGGLMVAGRRVVFVNATIAHDIDFDGADQSLPATMPGWRTKDAFRLCDAGPGDFTVAYDVESGKFGDFWFSGSISGFGGP